MIQDSNGVYWLAWKSNWGGWDRIWVSSSNDGETWEDPAPVVTQYGEHTYPSMIQDSDGTYWIAWRNRNLETYPYEFDIQITSSSDGINWDDTPTNVTSDDYYDSEPSLIQDSAGTYRIAWSSYRTNYRDICLSYSNDPDNSWMTPTQITVDSYEDYAPSLIENVDGGFNITWYSDRTYYNEIWFSGSWDWSTWSTPENVTEIDNPSTSKFYPSLIQDSNETFWIAWRDLDSYWDYNIWISYKINNEPPSVSITTPAGEQSGNIPIQYTLSDSGHDLCDIVPLYSLDGNTFYDAAQGTGGDSVENLSSSATGITHTFNWASNLNISGVDKSKVYFRILPKDCQFGELYTTGAFQVDNNALPEVEIDPITDVQSGSVNISYTLKDEESDVISINADYSTDKTTYYKASIALKSDKTSELESSSAGISYTFIWDSYQDLKDKDESSVYFRITPTDNEEGLGDTTSSFHLDNKAPDITSGPTVSSLTHETATITWNTDEPSDTVVRYGIGSNYGNSESGTLNTTSHSLTLSSLDAETTYHFCVSSTDPYGNGPIESEDNTFKTKQVPNNLPEVEITSLKQDETISGTITILGEASDPDGDGTLQFVEIKIDDEDWDIADGLKAWSYELDTTDYDNGQHIIYVRAYDGRNYSEEYSLSVEVENEENILMWLVLIAAALGAVIVLTAVALKFRPSKPEEAPPQFLYTGEQTEEFIPVAEPATGTGAPVLVAEPVVAEAVYVSSEADLRY
ncbi:MAG: hypothetical protein JSV56_12600 [Methanomassiliicoccales archaeon]|nr:MAG: hypothetical protein JSV56_12600 [Methanomassiliicoccales archaeon]